MCSSLFRHLPRTAGVRRLLRTGSMSAILLSAVAGDAAGDASSLVQARGPEGAGDLTSTTIRKLVEDAHHPLLARPDYPDLRPLLMAFYQRSDFQPVWQGEPAATGSTVADALALLNDAPSHGLREGDYDASLVGRLWADRAGLDGPRRALLDVGLTVALLRRLSDVSTGRVDPGRLGARFDNSAREVDLASTLWSAVQDDRIEEAFAEAEPPFGQYALLVDALGRYRALAGAQDQRGAVRDEWAADLPEPAGSVLRPGSPYIGLPRLAARLRALGDLEPGERPSASDAVGGNAGAQAYDGALVEAVRRFQGRHGLTQDGVVGPATLAALNTPLQTRVEQIELALERLRWLPALWDRPFIVVNIPAFELWAFDARPPGEAKFLEAGPAERMRVVVGKALSKQTPVFMEDMRYLELRPYWNVPYSITVREILPHARRNPGYLDANGYEIVPQFGNDIAPLPVTAANIERLGSGQLHLRQRPGPTNALGLVKFIFPNADNVYLHSTPATELFERTRRDFSHGCVRVEKPVALSEFVLRSDGAHWSREEIVASMNGERPQRVTLDTPIPVVIFYTTALVEPDGTVRFFPDIYGHDAALQGILYSEAGPTS